MGESETARLCIDRNIIIKRVDEGGASDFKFRRLRSSNCHKTRHTESDD